MKHIFTDGSFDHRSTDSTTENIVRGKIAIVGEGLSIVEKVAIGKVPALKQYINILELVAIARAMEIAKEQGFDEDLTITTDSMTAMAWARAGKIKNKKVETQAHIGAIGYLNKVRTDYGKHIDVEHIGRDSNPAGKLLEAELEREAPHTK